MENVFLACFLFGALFTVASALLGAVGHGAGHEAGHGGHAGHGAGHGGHAGHVDAGHAGTPGHGTAHGDGEATHGASGWDGLLHGLPVLNLSSLVAFLTWFGAAGFLLLHFASWPLLGAVAVAIVAGLVGAFLIALFLGRLMAGERVMDARQYRLPGTLARVTVGIPSPGVGEIVFVKGGVRRGEAARSRTGRPIARGTQVVILDYRQGVAEVQPFDELLAEGDTPPHAMPDGEREALPDGEHDRARDADAADQQAAETRGRSGV
jgi:membrane protein implicated in regulation of membrane protease activity